ncbi:MAG: endo-1,4-beta-xylanase [Alphaproteobacteria bacterium]
MSAPHLSRRTALVGGLGLLAGPACGQSVPLLQVIAGRKGILFGAAIEPQSVEGDADFAALIARQCAILTPENAMKWDALRPTEAAFDFDGADRVAAIARTNSVPLHGHGLLWHEAMPDWLAPALRKGRGEGLLRDHIDTVVRRYSGVVRSWDVVNEVVERNDGRPDGLRISPWLKALGPDYIDIAFAAAQTADPGALLALSDYGLEYDDEPWMVEKRGTMLALLRELIRRRVPVQALALQGHLIGDRPAAFGSGLKDFLDAVRGLGLKTLITELDVSDQNIQGSAQGRDQIVADIYARFLEAVLTSGPVEMVTTWGLSDRYTSKSTFFPRSDGDGVRPLPFDVDLRPKAAAYALARAFGSS